WAINSRMTSAVWSQSKSLLFNSSRRNLVTSLAVNLSSMGSLPDFNSVRIWIERSAVIRKVSWIGNVQVSCQTRMPDIESLTCCLYRLAGFWSVETSEVVPIYLNMGP